MSNKFFTLHYLQINGIDTINEIKAPKYEKAKQFVDASVAYGAIAPYAGLLVIPPAIINS